MLIYNNLINPLCYKDSKINKKYILPILFYFFGSVILTIPILIFIFFKIDNLYFKNIIDILIFKFNLFTVIFLIIVFILIMVFELFFFDKESFENNLRNIELLLGEKNNIFLNFILCFFTGYFEEVLFRGYLYYLVLILSKSLFFGNILSIILISLIFGFLHITQGKIGIIASSIISIIFFISIVISNTIWYAIIFHFIFNFVELSFIFPYQKRMEKKSAHIV